MRRTTEADSSSRRSLFPQISVRARIAVAVALLVAIALGAAGLVIAVLGRADAEERVRAAVTQEIAEFLEYQDENREVTSSRRLINGFLLTNVTSPSELLIGFGKGQPIRSAASEDRADLLEEPAFLEAAVRLTEQGGVERLQTRWGDVYLESQPINDGGALLVAYFVDDEYVGLEDTLRTYAVASFLALVLITGAAAWIAGRLLRPVRLLRETAEEIEETDLSRRIPEKGNDDITDLTRTVNAMLGRLERGFAGQRAFLDDAGHELRTPLTILHGHLELIDPDDPEDVARTKDLVIDELDRMSRLVDDLLLLAKADRPDFIRADVVDLAELIPLVADKCRGLGERDWVLDSVPVGQAVIDEQRITQALVQLAANAVKHTDEGDSIGIGAEVTAEPGNGVLRVWVRDTGPGVADEFKGKIFQRFGRGEVRDDDEGFGLGLSIVSAIAGGHNGSVAVYDEHPNGARFVIELPLSTTRGGHLWPAS